MEKDYRLIVKNLPNIINETQIQKLFEEYVTVNKVDLKERKDFNDKVNKFSFVNVTTTDRKLNSCLNELNDKDIHGTKISVELAKESFLDRLKKERNQDIPKSSYRNNNNVHENTSSFSNIQNNSHKKFLDLDLSSENYIHHEKEKKKFEYSKFNEDSVKENNSFEKFYPDFKESNDSDTSKKEKFQEYKWNKSNESRNNKLKKNFTNVINKNDSNIIEELEVNNSEKKRLMSVKQKRQVFKAQEQTIREALKQVDGVIKPNKKIIFEDNIEQVSESNDNKNESKKCSFDEKKKLFDDDEDVDNDYHWNEDELDAKADLKNKLSKFKLNTTDKRFILDERFVEEEDKVDEMTKNSEDSKMEDEKKWQLSILENVLGKSIKPTTIDNNNSLKKKNKMIRYDPTASNHEEYEVHSESVDIVPKKKKKKSNEITEKEETVIPVSTDVFYEVSDTLMENLKTEKKEEFSLLKTFGRVNLNDDKNKDTQEKSEENANFEFKYKSKNPFKYDSTDDEMEEDTETILQKSKSTVSIKDHQNNTFFFNKNDSRFHEAKEFFKKKLTSEDDPKEFLDRRRKMKEIVRIKIRRNQKKKVPWNKKKVQKVRKLNKK